jgi:hypothetical protein
LWTLLSRTRAMRSLSTSSQRSTARQTTRGETMGACVWRPAHSLGLDQT